MAPKIIKTEDEWKAELAPDRFHVLREKGTEPAWTGALLDVHDPGLFRCAACGAALFRSDDKFDSGSGWPSFTKAAADGVINEHDDSSFGMRRTEVTCANCGGHLGHVFPDGPAPTGETVLHQFAVARVRAQRRAVTLQAVTQFPGGGVGGYPFTPPAIFPPPICRSGRARFGPEG